MGSFAELVKQLGMPGLMADLTATLQESLRVVPPLWSGHDERAIVEPPGDVE